MRSSSPLARTASACVLATIAVVACATDERHRMRGEETTAKVEQDLSQAQAFGASLPPKVLALTFDDGPGTRTAALSTYLKDENIKATFFVNGQRIAATKAPLPAGSYAPTPNAAAILAQLQADGHLIANHTTTHRDVRSLNAAQVFEELKQTDDLIAPYVPANRFLFRAPFGNWANDGSQNPNSPSTALTNLSPTAMNKYVGPIYWEAGGISNAFPARAADWWCWQNNKTSAQCGDAYINEIEVYFGKGIVLMHDPYPDPGDPTPGTTLDMVKHMVPLLKGKGYTFVRLDQVPDIAAQLPCDASCATCSGPEANQCTTCAAGKFVEAGTCKTCSVCPAGSYETAACAANADTTCAACDPACTTCTGAGNAACTACKAGYWLSGTTCWPCAVCAAGTFASAACTPTTDTTCTACNAVCTTCSGPGPNDCGTCGAGKYLANGACATCATCAAGTSQTAACTATTNTVCTPCAAGTWAAANAATCTACGSCDDGNACTADTCDKATGCAHTAIAGCTPGVDAGSSGAPGGGGGGGGGGSSSGEADGGLGSSGGGGDPEEGCAVTTRSRGAGGGGPLSRPGAALLGALALLVVRRRSRGGAAAGRS